MSDAEKIEALIARLTKPTRQLHRHTRELISKSSPAIQHEAAHAIRALLDELSRLREVERASRTFVDKLKLCHEDERYRSVWTIAHLHIGAYTGPQYADELAALERALSDRSQEGREP